MENPTLGIRCRIVAWIPTGIHWFDGDLHKIRSDPSRSGRRIKSLGQNLTFMRTEQFSVTALKLSIYNLLIYS